MSLVVDHSGRIHDDKKKPSIKDVLSNQEDRVGWWVIEGSVVTCFDFRVFLFTLMFPILNSFHLIPINPCQVLLATARGSGGSPHLSTVTLQKSILLFYSQCKLFPSGVVAEMDSVQKWARKCGKAIKRLVPPNICL
jgi:hypothetical protein